jgi:tetratricopeptide (TPR) repeat protein
MHICLNMIVKNEAAVIARCLRSALPHVHSWAIVDTGSTDGTQDLIRELAGELPGELIERPWVDFAANRNQALDLARRHGDYALILDADDMLEVDRGRRFGALTAPGYALEIVDRTTRYWRDALVRLDVDWHWRGVVHEELNSSQLDGVRKLGGARILRIGGGARSQGERTAKYRRDIEILRKALAAEPDNTRYAFYLAQSLRDAGDSAEAIDAYAKRVAMGGWEEEVYFSKFMIAWLRQELHGGPAEVVAAYQDAHRFRPRRAEAAFFLARYAQAQGRLDLARDYARLAANTPVPNDSLFVNHNVYGWRARELWSAVLHDLGEFSDCATVCRLVLADPQLPAAERGRIEHRLENAIAAAARGHA